ncbi:MAG: HNH endonuclease [Candidatus Bathyarchaeota archaeon]|nr:HNH endonuclease [Candidatus Bathyarchaeum sp.]
MARDFAKKFYRSEEWQRVRGYILRRDNYLCVYCGEPAEEVHHIIHLNRGNIDNKDIAVGEDNLVSVCRNCHFEKHREDIRKKVIESNKKRKEPPVSNGYRFDDNGQVVPVTNKVCIVWGSPGSGKTTYVNSRMNDGDMVIDLDLIKQAISMQGKTETSDSLLDTALRLRDLLYDLTAKREVDAETIWVVAGLPNKKEREQLSKRLNGELIHINTSMEECIRRVRTDEERKDKDKQIELIKKWWGMYNG